MVDVGSEKVKDAAGSKCFVLTLNRSDNALPEAVLNASAPVNLSTPFFFDKLICDSFDLSLRLWKYYTGLLVAYSVESQWLFSTSSRDSILFPTYRFYYFFHLFLVTFSTISIFFLRVF